MAQEIGGTVNCVTAYVDGIFACYTELCSFPDLEPSLKVNNAFEKLVGLCSRVPNDADTSEVGSLSSPSTRLWVTDSN